MTNINSLLLPYQKKWLADESPVKVWEKSRRIGATWCEAADAVLIAGSKKSPMDYYYTSINESLSREFIRDAANWAEQFNIAVSDIGETLLNSSSQSIRVQQIIFATGKKIMGVPSNPSVLRGRMGCLCADEWSFVENPDELLKAGMAFLMWGGKVRIISTHNGVDSRFNQIVNDIRAGRSRYSLHRTTLDDALEEGLYKRICLKTKQKYKKEAEEQWKEGLIDFYGQRASDEELFCIPSHSEGSYFPRILVERAMDNSIPVFNLTLKDDFPLHTARASHIADWIEDVGLHEALSQLQPNYKTSFGFDFGRSGDLSYLIVLQELPNLVRKSAFAIEMRNVPFTEQEQVLWYVLDRCQRLTGGNLDSRGNGQQIAERTADRYGRHRIEQVMLSQPWYSENMPKYKAALEDQKIILPADSDILSDHRSIHIQRGIPKPLDAKNKDTKGLQRHSDSAVAFCLGFAASCLDNETVQPALGSFVFDNYQLGSS